MNINNKKILDELNSENFDKMIILKKKFQDNKVIFRYNSDLNQIYTLIVVD